MLGRVARDQAAAAAGLGLGRDAEVPTLLRVAPVQVERPGPVSKRPLGRQQDGDGKIRFKLDIGSRKPEARS